MTNWKSKSSLLRLSSLLVGGLLLSCSSSTSPATDTSQQEPFLRIFAGGAQTCVSWPNNDFKCWGFNEEGELGLGFVEDPIGQRMLPSSYDSIGVPAGVKFLHTNSVRSIWISENDEMSAWGKNVGGYYGNHGDEVVYGDDEPMTEAPSAPLGGEVVAFDASSNGTCSVFSDGGLRCIGPNHKGMLGLGHDEEVDRSSPEALAQIPLVQLGEPARTVAVGGGFACAVLESQKVRCWGRGPFGLLGVPFLPNASGDTVPIVGDDEHPEEIPTLQLAGPVSDVEVYLRHACAIHTDGTVSCWGETGPWLEYGERLLDFGDSLGDDEHPSVAGTVDVGGPVTKIALGEAHTCALLESGDVKCWGAGHYGGLGYGDAEYRGYEQVPADYGPVPIDGRAVDLVAGNAHTCVVLDTNEVRCWGNGPGGALGQPGFETIGDDEPANAVPVVKLAAD